MKLNENRKYGGTVALLRFSHLLRLGMFRRIPSLRTQTCGPGP